VTDLAKIKSPIDVVNTASERLGRSAKATFDQLARDAIAVGGTQVLCGVGAPATRAAIASTDLLRAADLRRLKGKMQAANIPPFADGSYIIFVHPYVEYDLKSDDDSGGWIDVNKYNNATVLINGELGKLEGFRVVTVNNAPTVTSTVTVYESLAIGAVKGWGMGDLMTLRTAHVAAQPSAYDPLGLNEYLGWVGMYGVGVIDADFYMRAEHAATSLA
jgi:N4-gp56 family major capsid protein